jgi:hypothetical protein
MSKGKRNRKKRDPEQIIARLKHGLAKLNSLRLQHVARLAKLDAKIAAKEAEIAKAEADNA